MTAFTPFLLELERIDDQVNENRRKIELGVDTLEDGLKDREGKRKQIMV